jgi:hypothetical protein
MTDNQRSLSSKKVRFAQAMRALGIIGISIQTGTALLRLLPLEHGVLLGLFTTAHLEGGTIALPFILWVVASVWLKRIQGKPLASTRLVAALWVLLFLNLLLPVTRIGLYAVQGVAVPEEGFSRSLMAVSYLLHLGSGYFILVLGIVLVGRSLWNMRNSREEMQALSKKLLRSGALTVSFCALFGFLYFFLLGTERDTTRSLEPEELEHLPSPARTSSGDTWQLMNPISTPLGCGTLECHGNIYQQWQFSAHAQSATDPAYTAVLEELIDERGLASTRLCAGCHDPGHLLSGGLNEGGQASSSLSSSGVSCIVCHRMKPTVVEGRPLGNGAYEFSPPELFPFELTAHRDLQELAKTLEPGEVPDVEGLSWAVHITQPYVYSNLSLHRAQWSIPSSETSSLCGTCHLGSLDAATTGWAHSPIQNTWSEWNEGPRANEHDLFPVEQCVDCHMTVTEPEQALIRDADLEDGTGFSSHGMAGGNTALYSLTSGALAKSQLQAAQKILQSAITLRATRTDSNLSVIATNVGAGHGFPSGSRDLDRLWLEVTAKEDPTQLLVQRPVLRTKLVDRHGNQLLKHQIWKGLKQGEAGIAPGESREWRIPLDELQDAPRGDLRVRLLHQSWPVPFAEHVLEKSFAPPITEIASTTLKGLNQPTDSGR